MKKFLTLILMAALFFTLPAARASIGRDILVLSVYQGLDPAEDHAITLEADGSRHFFPLGQVPDHVKKNPDELLFFLRTHGLSDSSLLHGAAMPEALTPIDLQTAQDLRTVLAQLQEQPFESSPYAKDTGSTFLYAVVIREGEAKLTLIYEGGANIGYSSDSSALLITYVAGPLLIGE